MADRVRKAVKRAVPAGLHRHLRGLGRAFDRAALEQRVLRDRLRPSRPRPHGLPGPLILSLTSYPPRFATLHRSLKCLLGQGVRPDRTILWLGEGEAPPARVSRLVARGLEIRHIRHLGAYSKLLHALEAFPDAFVVTADDDAYYRPDWLESLIKNHDPASPAILCGRAHRLGFGPDGALLPFADWEKDVRDGRARKPSSDLVPTGVGGVLYPPGSLDPSVADEALFNRLCPQTDDFWFYWMARRAGSRHRLIGRGFDYRDWPGSQRVALHPENLAGRYDRQLAALVTAFGLPCQPEPVMA